MDPKVSGTFPDVWETNVQVLRGAQLLRRCKAVEAEPQMRAAVPRAALAARPEPLTGSVARASRRLMPTAGHERPRSAARSALGRGLSPMTMAYARTLGPKGRVGQKGRAGRKTGTETNEKEYTSTRTDYSDRGHRT